MTVEVLQSLKKTTDSREQHRTLEEFPGSGPAKKFRRTSESIARFKPKSNIEVNMRDVLYI